MKSKFELKIESVSSAKELPNSWPKAECLALLKALEFEDISTVPEEQLRDYAVMALQDLDVDDASKAIVDLVFGEKLTSGKKQNIAEEMLSDRLWEEYPDLGFHEAIFNAQLILNQAFPETPCPEINKIEATLSSLNQAAEAFLKTEAATTVPEALVIRCIAAAMPEDSILNRLFEDQIKSGLFPEAESIVWQIQAETLPSEGSKKERRKLSLFSPIRWTSDLEDDQEVECEPFVEEND